MGLSGGNIVANARTSLRDLREQARWCHVGYALFIAFNFIYLHDALPLIGQGGFAPATGMLFLVVFFGVRCACAAGCAGISYARPGSVSSKVAAGFAALLLVIGVTLSVAVLRVPGLAFGASEASLLLALSAALLGVGDGLLLMVWGRFCATLPLRTTYLFVLLSYVIALVVAGSPLSLLPLVLLVAAWASFGAMPFLVGRSLTGRKISAVRPGRDAALRAFGALWRPVLLAALFALLSNFMLFVSGQQAVEAASAQLTSTLVTLAVVLVLLVPALVSARAVNIAASYRIALPLATGGFLLLAFVWNGGGGVANSLVAMGWLIADVISWCMIAEAVRETRAPAFLLFGIGEGAISLLASLGAVLGYFFASRIGSEVVALLVLALVVVYLFSTVVLFVLKDRSLAVLGGWDEEQAAASASGCDAAAASAEPAPVLIVEDRVQRSCAVLAARAQLTPRETDVLGCLAQGRSTQYMAEHLCISENTVKSHVRNVYQKLGVHSKQDIIDIINADEVEPA